MSLIWVASHALKSGRTFYPKTSSGPVIYSTSTEWDDRHCRFDVRLAKTRGEQDLALSLINKMYDWRGYGSSHRIPRASSYSTFLASMDGTAMGTITLGVDSDAGLAADTLFAQDIDVFRRAPGASVCELIKFAFDSDFQSRQILASLFHIVFLYGMRHYSCTDLFIEVNPRHRRFYEAMLGFSPIGAVKINPAVNAPAQLMHLKVSEIAAGIAGYTSRPPSSRTRSLYPLFLSHTDAQRVDQRITEPEFAN